MKKKFEFLGGRIVACVGDLTEQTTDAIVNAANSTLLGGGGVDGAIHFRGGPAIYEACLELRRTKWPEGLPAGEVVITTGGNLPARFVIHTVGPVWGEHAGKDAEILANCYLNAINLAAREGFASIAFPSISTGAFRYPPEEAAVVVSKTLSSALTEVSKISEVRLVFRDSTQLGCFLDNQRFAS